MNERQCQRCGKSVATERELDPAHTCPHGEPCKPGLSNCMTCLNAAAGREANRQARKAELAAQARATLPAGRDVLMAERGGVPSGVAAGPVGIVRGGR